MLSGRLPTDAVADCGQTASMLVLGASKQLEDMVSGWREKDPTVEALPEWCAGAPLTQPAQEGVRGIAPCEPNPSVHRERPVRPGDNRVEIQVSDLGQVVGEP